MSSHALLMDFYELTMANSYFEQKRTQEWAVFDYFFRRVPDDGGYAIFAGLEQLLDFIQHLEFDAEDIEFLRQKGIFSDGFLSYLREFKFRGEIYAFKEGSVIFPQEPVVTVRAPLIDCQILETFLLLTLNHQTLIATKAARICSQAAGRPVMEFGSRRAHGADAACYGARAAFIGGVAGTANVEADMRFGVPALGTMAHSYVQSFDSEFEAFAAYAECYPDTTILLVDTYDALRQGIPNAIRVHKEILLPQGKYLKGIRIDSGDLAYLSRCARELLDAEGLTETKITVSNALDEYLIQGLMLQNAAIDSFGVGERLITARSEPVFGGVYKIVAVERGDEVLPKIKISETVLKTTTPAFKQVYRFYDKRGMAMADVITQRDEKIESTQPYRLFDPEHPWKHKWVSEFQAKPLLNLVLKGGEYVGERPTTQSARLFAQAELETLWPEVKRLNNPHGYYVDLSQSLWDLKQSLIRKYVGE